MGSIETVKDFDKKLTTNIAKGEFSCDELLDWVRDYYSGAVTELILWDFSKADISKITNEEFQKIANEVKKVSNTRAGGKTALVFSQDIGFGLGRMYETFSDISNMPFGYRSFRSISEAKHWLGI